MLGVSLAPTKRVRLGQDQRDPLAARLAVDCRVPPGMGRAEAAQAAIDEVLGAGGYRIEWTEQVDGQPLAVRLAARATWIRGWVAEHDPRRGACRRSLPGFTDSRRSATPSPTARPTGSSPTASARASRPIRCIHSADERIDVRDLEFATEFFRDLARGLLG